MPLCGNSYGINLFVLIFLLYVIIFTQYTVLFVSYEVGFKCLWAFRCDVLS